MKKNLKKVIFGALLLTVLATGVQGTRKVKRSIDPPEDLPLGIVLIKGR